MNGNNHEFENELHRALRRRVDELSRRVVELESGLAEAETESTVLRGRLREVRDGKGFGGGPPRDLVRALRAGGGLSTAVWVEREDGSRLLAVVAGADRPNPTQEEAVWAYLRDNPPTAPAGEITRADLPPRLHAVAWEGHPPVIGRELGGAAPAAAYRSVRSARRLLRTTGLGLAVMLGALTLLRGSTRSRPPGGPC